MNDAYAVQQNATMDDIYVEQSPNIFLPASADSQVYIWLGCEQSLVYSKAKCHSSTGVDGAVAVAWTDSIATHNETKSPTCTRINDQGEIAKTKSFDSIGCPLAGCLVLATNEHQVRHYLEVSLEFSTTSSKFDGHSTPTNE